MRIVVQRRCSGDASAMRTRSRSVSLSAAQQPGDAGARSTLLPIRKFGSSCTRRGIVLHPGRSGFDAACAMMMSRAHPLHPSIHPSPLRPSSTHRCSAAPGCATRTEARHALRRAGRTQGRPARRHRRRGRLHWMCVNVGCAQIDLSSPLFPRMLVPMQQIQQADVCSLIANRSARSLSRISSTAKHPDARERLRGNVVAATHVEEGSRRGKHASVSVPPHPPFFLSSSYSKLVELQVLGAPPFRQ